MSAEIKPGYKMTEVGVIPEDWSVQPLRKILLRGRLGGNYANTEHETPSPLMKMGNITRGSFVVEKIEHVCDGQKLEPEHILKYGDVLLNTRNTLDLVGKVAIWRDELPIAYYNSNLMRLEFDSDIVCSNEYANYYLNHDSAVGRLRAIATGTTSVAAIYTRDLLEFDIPIPAKSEQLLIGQAVSDADALIVGLEQLIAKKRNIKQAAMQQLLTGKTRLPGFNGKWDMKRFEEVSLVDPESLSSITEPAYSFNYISLEDVDRGSLVGYSEQLFVSAPSRARRVVRHLDILISTVRPNLKSHLLFRARPGTWICSTGFSVVRCRPEVAHPNFIFQHLFADDIAKQIDALITGSNYPAINSSDVRGLIIPIPSIVEQTAIAAILSDMDAELTALEARCDKARQLKQGMMQELLTGRIRLV